MMLRVCKLNTIYLEQEKFGVVRMGLLGSSFSQVIFAVGH